MDLQKYVSNIRGFNYTPSYCTTGYEQWMNFNPYVWSVEITRGKKYFPGLNMLRIWLDWDAYLHNPAGFVQNFERVMNICGNLGIDVNPTLFNRWHDFNYDFGGIYYDHLIGSNFMCFENYINDLVGSFKDDPRIGMWDLCNEPLNYNKNEPLCQIEVEWLKWIADKVRGADVKQPVTVGTWGAETSIGVGYHETTEWKLNGFSTEWVADLCDVLCFHPYHGWRDDGLEKFCDLSVNIAKKHGKPLIANETCTGSLDDNIRVQIINKTLKTLKDRGIGWCAWTLHAGSMISSNREITESNSYMAFIDIDGSLRAGHEVYNLY